MHTDPGFHTDAAAPMSLALPVSTRSPNRPRGSEGSSLWPPSPAGRSWPSCTVSSALALSGSVGRAWASAITLRGIFILPMGAAVLGFRPGEEASRERTTPDHTPARAPAPCSLPPICYQPSAPAPKNPSFYTLGFTGETREEKPGAKQAGFSDP